MKKNASSSTTIEDRLKRRFENFKNFSELQTAVSEQLKASQKALGLTRKEWAKRLGLSVHTVNRIVDRGYPFNQEFAFRAVKVNEGFTFEKHDPLEHRIRSNKNFVRVETYLEPKLYKKFEQVCKAENCSPATVMYNYARMGIEGILATTTWLQAYQAAWQAILAAEMRRSPWLNYVLEMDPAIARAEADSGRKPVDFPDDLPVSLPSSYVVRELSAGTPFDGPAIPVITDWETDT